MILYPTFLGRGAWRRGRAASASAFPTPCGRQRQQEALPRAAPRPRARRPPHQRPAGQPAAAANFLNARPCPDRAPRNAHQRHKAAFARRMPRPPAPGARSVRLSKIFAGHQSELGLGAAPARRRGVPGPLVVRRDVLSLGPLRVRFELECWLLGLGSRTALQASGGHVGVLPEGARVPFARLEAASG